MQGNHFYISLSEEEMLLVRENARAEKERKIYDGTLLWDLWAVLVVFMNEWSAWSLWIALSAKLCKSKIHANFHRDWGTDSIYIKKIKFYLTQIRLIAIMCKKI